MPGYAVARSQPTCDGRRSRAIRGTGVRDRTGHMDETQPPDDAAAPRSTAATLALAGVGLLGAGNRRAVRTFAHGARAAAAVGAPVWHPAPPRRARRAGRSVLEALVEEAARHELRWRAELETT